MNKRTIHNVQDSHWCNNTAVYWLPFVPFAVYGGDANIEIEISMGSKTSIQKSINYANKISE